jgi:transcriptional regulator of acetoin/glycerol metabolism
MPILSIVCDQTDLREQAKKVLESSGFVCEAFTEQSYKEKLRGGELPGLKLAPSASNVVAFPGTVAVSAKVSTMNEVESKAIESAIYQFRGNLTEAAKALGIGRATLYRKVKLYQIDPNPARRKRAA